MKIFDFIIRNSREKLRIAKSLLVVILLLCSFQLSYSKNRFAVTKDDVTFYLLDYEYCVEDVVLIENSDDWISTNCDQTHTVVYVTNGIIVGHEDVDY